MADDTVTFTGSYNQLSKEDQAFIQQEAQALKYLEIYYERNRPALDSPESAKSRDAMRAGTNMVNYLRMKGAGNNITLNRTNSWASIAQEVMRSDPAGKEYQDAKRDAVPPPLTDHLTTQYTDVEWGFDKRRTSDFSADLITREMSNCNTLIIVDPAHDSPQTLAHIFPTDNISARKGNAPAPVNDLVRQHPNSKTKYYVVIGENESIATYELYASLRASGVARENIRIIPQQANQEWNTQNIIVHNGGVARASDALASKVHIASAMKSIEREAGSEGIAALQDALKAAKPNIAKQIAEKYQQIQDDPDIAAADKKITFRTWLQSPQVNGFLEYQIEKNLPPTATKQTKAAVRAYTNAVTEQILLSPEKPLQLFPSKDAVHLDDKLREAASVMIRLSQQGYGNQKTRADGVLDVQEVLNQVGLDSRLPAAGQNRKSIKASLDLNNDGILQIEEVRQATKAAGISMSNQSEHELIKAINYQGNSASNSKEKER